MPSWQTLATLWMRNVIRSHNIAPAMRPNIWVLGARPRTLPAALAPVIAGVASVPMMTRQSDWSSVQERWPMVVLCAVISLALQIGVNYANDYSDGIRGTDDDRVGPTRLVASGLASPKAVRNAAVISLGLAALAGLVAIWWTGHWWLLLVGLAAIAAAWFYTGGPKPYGYAGLGEVFVFVFFGLVATVGTAYLICDEMPATAWFAAIAVGTLATGLLVVNNLRDLQTDRETGKHTLATRIGDRATRMFYSMLIIVAGLAVVAFASITTWFALVALLGLIPLIKPLIGLWRGASGKGLLPALQATGIAELLVSIGLLLGVLIG